jgi:hypothetical protein
VGKGPGTPPPATGCGATAARAIGGNWEHHRPQQFKRRRYFLESAGDERMTTWRSFLRKRSEDQRVTLPLLPRRPYRRCCGRRTPRRKTPPFFRSGERSTRAVLADTTGPSSHTGSGDYMNTGSVGNIMGVPRRITCAGGRHDAGNPRRTWPRVSVPMTTRPAPWPGKIPTFPPFKPTSPRCHRGVLPG